MLKVLIVEDEELIRKGIALTVDWATLDCVVVGEAANGAEGLEKAEKCDPDLIITDLKMPQMDGIEMLEKLRGMGKNTYVIILTAYDSFSYIRLPCGWKPWTTCSSPSTTAIWKRRCSGSRPSWHQRSRRCRSPKPAARTGM